MAISTFKVFLMTSTDGSSAWEKLVDIKDFPDLGGAPEMLETTTLSDRIKTFIAGIQSQEAMNFTINHDLATYKKIQGMAHKTTHLAVWLGGTDTGVGAVTPTGEHGKLKFDGDVSIYISGKGVNEVVEDIITVAPSTTIELDETV